MSDGDKRGILIVQATGRGHVKRAFDSPFPSPGQHPKSQCHHRCCYATPKRTTYLFSMSMTMMGDLQNIGEHPLLIGRPCLTTLSQEKGVYSFPYLHNACFAQHQKNNNSSNEAGLCAWSNVCFFRGERKCLGKSIQRSVVDLLLLLLQYSSRELPYAWQCKICPFR